MPPKPIGEISSSVRPRVVILSEAKDLQLRGSRSFADSAAQDDAISPQHLRHDLAGRGVVREHLQRSADDLLVKLAISGAADDAADLGAVERHGAADARTRSRRA